MSTHCLVACAFVGAVISGPAVAQAAPIAPFPIEIVLEQADWPEGSIGVDGLQFTTLGYISEYPDVALSWTISHGALTRHDEIVDPPTGTVVRTLYGYANPYLEVTAEWATSNGVSQVGTFRASVIRTDDDYFGSYDGLVVTVDENPSRPFGPKSVGYLALGQGTFSANLAELLGVQRFTSGGLVDLVLEEIQQGPKQRPLVVAGNSVWIDAETRAVPEPATLCLFGAAMLLHFSRGSARRR